MADDQRVAKNTLFLTVGSIAQKILAFVYFTVLARHFLLPEDVGRYLYALSYAALFSVIVDFGVQPVLIRAIAKDKSRSHSIIGNALGIKAVLAVLTASAMFIVAHVSESDPVKIALISIACITLVLDSIQLTFYAVMRGYEQLKYEALGVLVGQGLVLIVGGTMLYFKQPLPFLMFAYVAGSLWNAAYSWRMARKVTGVKFKILFTKKVWGEILKLSLPFAGAAVFVRIYSSADSVLLNRIAGNVAAAFYGVPFKFVFAFQFLPIALAAALYPTFAREVNTDKKRTGELFADAERYLLLIVFPLVAGMFALAEPLIISFYRVQYLPSVAVMQILAWCLIPAFLDYPVGALLNAGHKQNIQTSLMGLIMALSVIFNLILIPIYGAIGSAVTAVGCSSILFFGGLIFASRLANIPWKKLGLSVLRIAIAAAVMGTATVVLHEHLRLYYSIALGVLIYLGALFLLHEIGRPDVMRLRNLLRPSKPENIEINTTL